MEPLVSLRNVALSTPSYSILQPISLSIEAGSAIAIIGPNGAGKSSLLRVLATLTPPSAGDGQVLGARLGNREVLRVRHRIGLAGHIPALAPGLTLGENLSFYARLAGISEDRVEPALESVGLTGARNRRAVDCSAGMRRRADLSRLLVNSPQLLLLDEPTDTLDSSARPIVDQLVLRTISKGGVAVVVSHDRENLGDNIHRIHALENGKLA
ncbi:MAG TPA: heme ABC exporter ATP-binding protein CcmA [Acidimicrobiia bacterium]|nr:heme ABC exporter ATP-binding protein CcmA [Acidimicrobiia bacterium]